jgi:iron complex transport system substrate-binding protein
VLAANPTLVIGPADSGPAPVVDQIKAAGVTTLLLPNDPTVANAKARIMAIGQALGKEAEAQALVTRLDADLTAATALAGKATSKPKVLFVIRPPGAPDLIVGTGTEADAMIALAGGQNAVTIPGAMPLSAEAVAAAAPDVILTTTSSIQSIGGLDAFLAEPGVAQTPAGQKKAVVDFDDLYLLGFGPRLGQAVHDLALKLHPELAQP